MGLFKKKKSLEQLRVEYAAVVAGNNLKVKTTRNPKPKKMAQRIKISDPFHQKYYDLAADITDANTDDQILRACRQQLAMVDKYMAKEKKEFGSNMTKSVAALRPHCVKAAANDPDLLIRMAEILNRYPNLAEDQVQRVRKALTQLGLAE